jgi:small subunit ribosomal protein S9
MPDEPEKPDTPERDDTAEPSRPGASEEPAADVAAEAAGAQEPEATQKAKAPKRRRKPKAAAAEESESQPAAQAQEAAAPADAAEPAAPAPQAEAEGPTDEKPVEAQASTDAETRSEGAAEQAPRGARAKPEVPGAHLEVDIVPEGVDPLGREQPEDPYAISFEEEEGEAPSEEMPEPESEQEEEAAEPIVSAAIDLAAGARYSATGKRKTAVARVILRPGGGTYTINGRSLPEYFPRSTLQRNIAQPLEAVGYQDRMDVVARLHGGGVSSQAGALRHGISRALLEADPNLRGELKRRGFLTRDSRVKERKKAGLKKARKRPQFSKR